MLDSLCLRREGTPFESREERGDVVWRWMEGRISFFCFEAGRISSRSTGTPRETRKSRRMRERIQSGGWRGGGATSWDQREALLWVRKTGFSVEGFEEGFWVISSGSGGYNASMYVAVASRTSSRESKSSKSGIGCFSPSLVI